MNAPEKYLTWRFDDEDEELEKKVTYHPDSKRPNAGTFVVAKEDYTLGNLVRTQLLRDPSVRFAGYRLPHPLVIECHIRIKSMDSKLSPPSIFEAALADSQLETEILSKTFDAAVVEFERGEFQIICTLDRND
jgi:DNA-directed RNA polymerase II subunit RPB11